MHGRPKNSVERIAALVREYKEQGMFFLPSLNDLCSKSGLSRMTVYKALHTLEQCGTLRIEPRRGIQIIGNPPLFKKETTSQLPQHEKVSRSVMVCNALLDDIREQRYKPGFHLPLMKDLCEHYGASEPVIRKALGSLCARKVLEKVSGGYFLSTPVRNSSTGTIVFLSFTNDMHQLTTLSPHASSYWQAIEYEAQQRNLLPEVVSYDTGSVLDEQYLNRFFEQIEKKHTVLGYILSTIAPGHVDVPLLVNCLARRRIPVAVLDENGVETELLGIEKYPTIFLFLIGTSETCGLVAGRFLLARGHRSFAFLTPGGTGQTGARRMAGLERACEELRLTNAVREFTPDVPLVHPDRINGLAEFRQVRKEVSESLIKLTKKRDQKVDDFTDRFLWDLIYQNVLKEELRPIFTDTLKHHEITAWVCFNDTVALHALEFLQSVKAHPAISVMGFDNTIEGLGQGLTSYSFNIPAIITILFDSILSTRKILRKSSQLIIDIPGRVVLRKSCKPCAVSE